jgi:hypothetical protein
MCSQSKECCASCSTCVDEHIVDSTYLSYDHRCIALRYREWSPTFQPLLALTSKCTSQADIDTSCYLRWRDGRELALLHDGMHGIQSSPASSFLQKDLRICFQSLTVFARSYGLLITSEATRYVEASFSIAGLSSHIVAVTGTARHSIHSNDRLTSIDRLLVGYGVGSIESNE